MIDPGFAPKTTIKSATTEHKNNELAARNYAWTQSLEKGIKLCRNNGHEGDAQTLEDIVKALKQTTIDNPG